jgi:hypothetical protein
MWKIGGKPITLLIVPVEKVCRRETALVYIMQKGPCRSAGQRIKRRKRNAGKE